MRLQRPEKQMMAAEMCVSNTGPVAGKETCWSGKLNVLRNESRFLSRVRLVLVF